MRNGSLTRTSFYFGVATAAVALIFGYRALATTVPSVVQAEISDNDINLIDDTYISDILHTERPFSVAGFAWRGDSHMVSFSFRLYDANGWSEWYDVESDSFVEVDGYQYLREPFMADQATRIQYEVTADGTLDEIKLVYLDPTDSSGTDGFNLFDWLFKPASAASTLTIIPRSGWQANESWRYDSEGNEEWPAEIVTPEKFIVHHTAGDPGTSDPAKTIQGIYYWHAVVLKWGDIGYNYLIDQNGKIYEGRAGGDGVIGAHAYRSAACAASRFGGSQNEAGFNRGTVGVAILGNYESSLKLNDAVAAALANLIGTKAALFGIDPSQSGFFVDKTYPHVIGHSDVDCTDCPGTNLYGHLGTVRTAAHDIFVARGGTVGSTQYSYSGEVTHQNILPATFTSARQTVTTVVTNTGTKTWKKGEVKLNIYDLGGQVSRFHDSSWPHQHGGFDFAESEVKPGATATFTSTFTSPDQLGQYLNIYRLTGPAQLVQQDDRSITRVDSRYQASLISQTLPPALLYTWRPMITVRFKNTGLATWDRHVTLDTFDLGGAVSRFVDRSWPSRHTPAVLQESSVKPGQTGTFAFRIDPPTPGLYLNTFYLQRWGEPIQDGRFSLITRVDG